MNLKLAMNVENIFLLMSCIFKYCLCLAALKELMTICDNHKVREPFCDMAILRRAPE